MMVETFLVKEVFSNTLRMLKLWTSFHTHRDTHTHTHRHRHTDRHTHRHTDRHTHTHTHTHTRKIWIILICGSPSKDLC